MDIIDVNNLNSIDNRDAKFWVLIFVFVFLAVQCDLWILVPWPGIKPWAPAVRALSPNHRTTSEFPFFPFAFNIIYL